MARFYAAGGYEELTMERAVLRGTTWDVFVSHRSGDDGVAEEVAQCVRTYGLTAWVDSDYLDASDDGPEMATKIKRVIERSYCLMAVVSRATKTSWWVPFEIGIASDMDRFLSSYGDPVVELPSFLAGWPRVKNHTELHEWCGEIKRQKGVYEPTVDEGIVKVGNTQRSRYLTEMQAMARRFPGSR